MIDRSGSGTFPVGEVSFVEAKQGKFPNIVWGKDAGNAEVFSLVIIPELFARCGIDNPACGQNDGKLQVEINGGTPPYTIQLTAKDNATNIASAITSASLYTLPAIAQGDYLLQVKDARGTSFVENIRIESIDAQNISLASDYIIKQGETLYLSVPPSEAAFYGWKLPDGQISYNPEINAAQAGTYYLILRNSEGCESSKRIDIASFNSNFSRLDQYPNPTADGYFWLDIGLYQESDVDVRIYNASGVLVGQSKLSGSSYYLYKGSLPQAGHYIIQLTSNGTSEKLKLIRN
jgi:hypothetical protein